MIELKVQITIDCDLILVQRLIKIHAGTSIYILIEILFVTRKPSP